MPVTIAIVTSCKNAGGTVTKTLASIAAQRHLLSEYIVINAGSTDNTMDEINKYRHIITCLISETDEGISDGFNKGIQHATADVIGIVSADDWLPSGALDVVQREYSSDHKIDVLYGNAIVHEIDSGRNLLYKPQESLERLKERQVPRHVAMYINRKAYNEYGLYGKRWRYAMDYELALRFYLEGARYKYVDEVLGAMNTGGINERHRINTIAEVKEISIRHGLSKWHAEYLYHIKVLKHLMRSCMPNWILAPLIRLNRMIRRDSIAYYKINK